MTQRVSFYKFFLFQFFIGIFLVSCKNENMFEITEEPLGRISQLVLKNNSTGEYVSIIPSFGATINQIALKKGDKVYELVEGCKTYEELMGVGKNTFRGSKLFPFPNRVRDGKYSFEGKEYQLPINFPQENNAIHGLVLTDNFKIIAKETSAEKALLTVQYEFKGDKEGYPFKCLLTINYELSSNGFACTTKVLNMDNQAIPIGDGWHPYFKTGSKVDNLSIKLPVVKAFSVDGKMIPTLPDSLSAAEIAEGINGYDKSKKIGSDKFDTGYRIYPNPTGSIVTTEISDTIQNIKLCINQETGPGKYGYLQVYTPPDRNSIAIEPMTCLTDAFNNKQGLIVLESAGDMTFYFSVELK
jgi:aldose 1-epimerase